MRPSVRRRVLPVARPRYFLAAPLAAWALWAIFLPMLIADSFVFGDDRSRLRADSIDRGSVPTGGYRRECRSVVDRATSDRTGKTRTGKTPCRWWWPPPEAPVGQRRRRPAGVRAVGRVPGSETPSRAGTLLVRVGRRGRGQRCAGHRPVTRSARASPPPPPRFRRGTRCRSTR